MDLKGAEIIGVKIISVKENKEIGTVKDIVYDPKKNKVIAFLVEEGDVVAPSKIIPFSEVEDVSKEAVLVKSTMSLQSIGTSIKPLSTEDNEDTFMQGTKIFTKNRQALGREKDIIFNTKTGEVNEFEVVSGDRIEDVKVETVVASSESTTVVKTAQEKKEKKGDSDLLSKVKSFITR